MSDLFFLLRRTLDKRLEATGVSQVLQERNQRLSVPSSDGRDGKVDSHGSGAARSDAIRLLVVCAGEKATDAQVQV